MLVLSRKENERIKIGDEVTLIICRIKGGRVSIGIEAPEHVQIVRGELEKVVESFEEKPKTTERQAPLPPYVDSSFQQPSTDYLPHTPK